MQPTSCNLLQRLHSGHFSPSPDTTPTAPKSCWDDKYATTDPLWWGHKVQKTDLIWASGPTALACKHLWRSLQPQLPPSFHCASAKECTTDLVHWKGDKWQMHPCRFGAIGAPECAIKAKPMRDVTGAAHHSNDLWRISYSPKVPIEPVSSLQKRRSPCTKTKCAAPAT